MRISLALAVVAAALSPALAGAGGERSSTGFAAPGARARPSPPSPPPKRPGGGPPPAWLETRHGSYWLGYSSFCWHTKTAGLCADYVAPSCARPRHTPRLPLRRGELVRFHLGFEPRTLSLAFFGPRRPGSTPVPLRVSRTPTWRVDHAGVFALFAVAKRGGDASYVACIVLR